MSRLPFPDGGGILRGVPGQERGRVCCKREVHFLEKYLVYSAGLNFLVHFLLLMGTNRLSGFPMNPARCGLGAGASTLYSGLCIRFAFLEQPLWRVGSLVLMGMITFGVKRSAVKRTCVFLLLSMALGGIARNLDRGDLTGLLLGGGLIWVLCIFSFGGGIGDREYVPVRLTYRGNTVRVLALRDTGNQLRDPVTGEQVLIVSGAVGQRLTGLTQRQLRTPMETLSELRIPGLRLIPYRAVGTGTGLLLGMRVDTVVIGKRKRAMVVAFDPDGLQADGDVQALLGGTV